MLSDGRLLSWSGDGTLRLQVRHQPLSALYTERICGVYLSYAHEDAAVIRALSAELAAAGFSVWYDTDIAGGERYRDRIDAQIDAAKAVVVLWSKTSVSDRVLSEASRAHRQNKSSRSCCRPLLPRRSTPPIRPCSTSSPRRPRVPGAGPEVEGGDKLRGAACGRFFFVEPPMPACHLPGAYRRPRTQPMLSRITEETGHLFA